MVRYWCLLGFDVLLLPTNLADYSSLLKLANNLHVACMLITTQLFDYMVVTMTANISQYTNSWLTDSFALALWNGPVYLCSVCKMRGLKCSIGEANLKPNASLTVHTVQYKT